MYMNICRMVYGVLIKVMLFFNLDFFYKIMLGDFVFVKKFILGKIKYVWVLNFYYLLCCIFFNVGFKLDIRIILISIFLIVFVYVYWFWYILLKYNLVFFFILLLLLWVWLVIISFYGILIFGWRWICINILYLLNILN